MFNAQPIQQTPMNSVSVSVAEFQALQAQVQTLSAMKGGSTSTADLASSIYNLERQMTAFSGHDKELVAAVRHIQTTLKAVSQRVAKHDNALDLKSKGVLATVVGAIGDEINRGEKQLVARFEQQLTDFMSGVKTALVGIEAERKQLSALADSVTELAAQKLMNHARWFALSPVGKNAGAKSNTVVQSTLIQNCE